MYGAYEACSVFSFSGPSNDCINVDNSWEIVQFKRINLTISISFIYMKCFYIWGKWDDAIEYILLVCTMYMRNFNWTVCIKRM